MVVGNLRIYMDVLSHLLERFDLLTLGRLAEFPTRRRHRKERRAKNTLIATHELGLVVHDPLKLVSVLHLSL